jgi:hypothetical protein
MGGEPLPIWCNLVSPILIPDFGKVTTRSRHTICSRRGSILCLTKMQCCMERQLERERERVYIE